MANRPIHVVESGGDSTGLKEFADGADSGVQLPSGTTAQRDSSASDGEIRFNSDTKKIEYYNGTNWVSNSFVDVEDAEYDGVMTIQSNTHSQIPTAYRGSIVDIERYLGDTIALDGYAQGKRMANSFIPFGVATRKPTHSGLTEADARFGAAGMNTLESEHSARHTPILEIKTDMADGAMGSSLSTFSNLGAIAWTGKIGTYDYSGHTAGTYGWTNANKDFNAAAITVRSKRMNAGYYDYYFAPPTDLDFFVSTGYSGPVNAFSISSRNGSHTGNLNAAFLLGRSGDYNNPTHRIGFKHYKFPVSVDGNVGTTKDSTHAHSFAIATTEHIRAAVAPNISTNGTEFGATTTGSGTDSNKTHYWIYHPPSQIINLSSTTNHNTNPFGTFHFIYSPRNANGNNTALGFHHKMIYSNLSSNTTRIYGIDTAQMSVKVAVRGYDNGINSTVTDWSSINGPDKITFDSSFPTSGSTTTGTMSAYGFITFDITGMHDENGDILSVRFSNWDTTNA
jgi:hypothetical protein